MQDDKNPLIADTAIETVQNVTEAMTTLLNLIAHDHSGLCRLMEPLLHALEHVADNENATMPFSIPEPNVRSVPCTSQCQTSPAP
jgi:hypothetical protein